jgi:Glycosyltransferase WbsX
MEVLVEINTRSGEELDANYGLYCFCYFHYWFHGRRILERLINEMWKSRAQFSVPPVLGQ